MILQYQNYILQFIRQCTTLIQNVQSSLNNVIGESNLVRRNQDTPRSCVLKFWRRQCQWQCRLPLLKSLWKWSEKICKHALHFCIGIIVRPGTGTLLQMTRMELEFRLTTKNLGLPEWFRNWYYSSWSKMPIESKCKSRCLNQRRSIQP